MKISFSKILPLVLLITLFPGCDAADRLRKKVEQISAPVPLTCDDGSCELIASSWSMETDREGGAILKALHVYSDAQVVIYRYPKSDYQEGLSLDEYAEILVSDLPKRLENAEIMPVTSSNIDGKDAREFEASGVMEKMKVKYLYALVDAHDDFYMIVSWALPSVYTKNRAEISAVVHSFRLIARDDAGATNKPKGPIRSTRKTPVK